MSLGDRLAGLEDVLDGLADGQRPALAQLGAEMVPLRNSITM